LAAAAVALPFENAALLAQTPASGPVAPEKFKLVAASQFDDALAGLHAKPGNFNFFTPPALPFTAVLTVEDKKAAKEFEWHEGRDHLLQVIDGSTIYEVGGTPQNAHSTKAGEWLAPTSQGATTLTLHKGDWLMIPRNTPHKRSTEASVTFYLISTTGAAGA